MNDLKSRFNSQSVTLKIFMIGALLILFMIPQLMIESVIVDRKNYFDIANNDVQKSWGSDQVLNGPVLTIPYTIFIKDKYFNEELKKYTERTSERKYLKTIYPKKLNVSSNFNHLSKERGIFDIYLYRSQSILDAEFDISAFIEKMPKDSEIHWNKIVVNYGIKDRRGISSESKLTLNKDLIIELENGNKHITMNLDGFHGSFKLKPNTKSFNIVLNLHLNGSESFQILPSGENTTFKLTSKWKNPGFIGYKLPNSWNIDENGIEANWTISKLSRSMELKFKDESYHEQNGRKLTVHESNAFGIQFLPEIDSYKMSDRSTKYATLFILLTFIVFFGFELFKLKTLHFIQYLFVGFSILIFFILLIALSEHFSFTFSYWISAMAITTMLTLYANSQIKTWKHTSILSIQMASLYVYLYIVLSSKDYALILGATGLFIIISILMFITRKIDWHQMTQKELKST